MPPFLIALAAGAGIVALFKKSAPAQLATTDQKPSTATKTAQAGGLAGAGAVAGEIAAVGAAAAAGALLGAQADGVLAGGMSTPASKGIATVGGALLGASAALLAFGTITGPIFGIVVAVVIAVYALYLAFDAQARFNDAQAWKHLAAWDKQWDDLHSQCFAHLQMQTDFSHLTPMQLDRMLEPFIDGYMVEMNRIAYRKWMKTPKGIFTEGVGVDSLGHAIFGAQHGFFVADALAMMKAGPTAYGALVDTPIQEHRRTANDAWARAFCPPDELYNNSFGMTMAQYSAYVATHPPTPAVKAMVQQVAQSVKALPPPKPPSSAVSPPISPMKRPVF